MNVVVFGKFPLLFMKTFIYTPLGNLDKKLKPLMRKRVEDLRKNCNKKDGLMAILISRDKEKVK